MSAPPSWAPRPDASMTLLREVVERPLDPGYAEAAAQREARARTAAADGEAPGRGWRSRRRVVLTALLAVLAGLLPTAAALELRVPAAPGDRQALVQEITRRTQRGDQLAAQVQRLRAEVQRTQQAALAGDPGAAVVGDDLLVASASTPVTGPGVRITLDDAKSAHDDPVTGDPRSLDPDDPGLVRYDDVQKVVNGLWGSGAEAIAINGQRLGSSTAIRNASATILVNYRPLSPPYRIEAVGSPNALQTRFAVTAAADFLLGLHSQFGIGFSVAAVSPLRLPAQDAQQLNYAHALRGAPAAPSASSSAPPTTTQEVSP
jgi:uncharacterized protein YlxW (UPF0749 family)